MRDRASLAMYSSLTCPWMVAVRDITDTRSSSSCGVSDPRD
jgi:hypothetical protein